MSGLSKEQVHRIKEDFQRAALVIRILKKRVKELNDEILNDIVALSIEEYDAIYRDIEGMLNGNKEGTDNGDNT